LEKSSSAFRTISEVAAELDVPKHVLRFWEGKFPQLRPMKRGGGRRYYRPEDIELLRGIRWLLYSDGYTIKGVQRILRDNGVKFVKVCWRDQPAEAGFPIPNLAGEAASNARRSARAERSIPSAMPVQAGRAKMVAGPAAHQIAPLNKDQRDFLQGLLVNLEECRDLLQAAVEQQEVAARPKARSGRRSASSG
jgi:DNA-binding transcriptional MerR regulator